MGKFPSKFFIGVCVLTAAVCGFLQALPVMGLPSANALLAAARGVAAGRGLEGYGAAGLGDRIAGWLWEMGGPSFLMAGEWAKVFVVWSLMTLAVLVVAERLGRLIRGGRWRRVLPGVAFLLVLAACVPSVWSGVGSWQGRVSDLGLLAPKELAGLVAEREGREVFANASALPYLLLFAPESTAGVSPAMAAELVGNPPGWREALRKSQWQAVVLSGPVEEYRRLLEHLVTSPDWHVAAVTNQGYLFLRGSGTPAQSVDVGKFEMGSAVDTAVYLAQVAGYYHAMRRTGDARKCMERALELAPNNVSVLAHAGTYALGQKRWQEAISYSNKALARDGNYGHAKLVKAVALMETGQPHRALPLVNEVLARSPDDLYTLFAKARVCKALSDYVEEADTLERIIAVSDRQGLPSMHYRIYLGQAYAKQGQPKPALKNYKMVLESGSLNEEQADEIREAIATIEAKGR